MTKILAALGLSTALMLTPVLAYADDAAAPAAPKADEKMAPKPVKHHKHHHMAKKPMKPMKHHTMKKMAPKADDKKMDKPADAPKT
jgi:hypothetical protein